MQDLLLYFFLGVLAGGFGVGYFIFRSYIGPRAHKIEDLTNQISQLTAQNHSFQEIQREVETRNRLAESLMEKKFEALAHRIFEERGLAFNKHTSENLESILGPLKIRFVEFEKKVEETYSAERAERGVLRGELNRLFELNKTMSIEASNLTRALKGENKTQGNWGELILENILDRSGLRKGEEYIVQGVDLSIKSADGANLRPDVIIQLPDNKHLIVDSKMTLSSYESYNSEEDEEIRERYGRQHVESLKRHIDDLSNKQYFMAEKILAPDFVILFMPIEPAFALAFRLKPDLLQYAWERNIAIVSPTTLLATLRTVATLWRQDRQEKNVLEIARRGGLLYEKFVGLLKDLEVVGDRLQGASKAHNEVLKKLSEGRGNLIDQVEELKRLGVKTDKQISNSYLEKQLTNNN